MRRPVEFTTVLIAFVTILCLAPISTLRAQNADFSCPKAGTVATFKVISTGVEWTYTYHGARSADPVVCRFIRSTDTSAGTNESRRLYNLFSVGRLGVVDTPELRAALQSFFSGQKDQVSFSYAEYGTDGRGPYSFQDTWTRVGHDAITIGGRNIDTIVIARKQVDTSKADSGIMKLWFDPRTGVFVKSEVTGASKPNFFTSTAAYVATSINVPN